jgi:predicted anti-sigma-YlaC factor YlaD
LNDDCAHCEEMMQPYLDHLLTDEEMAQAEAHLAECVDCRRRYKFEESLRIYARKAVAGRLDNPDEPKADGGLGVREPRLPTPSGL